MSFYPELLKRDPNNPILSAVDWPYPAHTVFNPGATRLQDGTTLLLCRVEDRRGFSHLCAARSQNGIDGWQIDPEPTLLPDPDDYEEEAWGIEDPRITYLPEEGRYAVVYTAFSIRGPGVSLALTEDFRTFERYGTIMPPEDKDAALLPRRIDGRWVLVHRPRHPEQREHLDELFQGPAPLARLQGGSARPAGGLVGRQQDRALAPAHRDAPGLAHDLPRRAPPRLGQPLPGRAGAF